MRDHRALQLSAEIERADRFEIDAHLDGQLGLDERGSGPRA
jgi:hypothetical protein